MAQFNIEGVLSDISSEVTVNKEGRGTISGRGLARLLGVSPSTFSVAHFPQKLAEKLSQLGFDPADFFSKDGASPAEFPDAAIPVITLYFGAQCQQPSKQAEAVLLTGLETLIRQLF